MRHFSGKPLGGVCFDLWNTLAFTDTRPGPIRVLATAFGLEERPDWRQVIERAMMTRRLPGIGAGIDAIAHETGRELRSGWTRRDLILKWGEACNRNKLYHDALPVLKALGRPGGLGLSLAIISNTQSFDLDLLRREGLESAVDAICLSCDVGVLKPDIAIYRHAADLMGLEPARILMVGDSLTDDVEGSQSAGMNGLLIDRSGICEPGPHPVIRALNELPDLITSRDP